MIVMEYASKGELYDYISERRRLSERETRHFFRQIVSAVHHCHKVRKTKLKSLPTYFAAPLSDPFASLLTLTMRVSLSASQPVNLQASLCCASLGLLVICCGVKMERRPA